MHFFIRVEAFPTVYGVFPLQARINQFITQGWTLGTQYTVYLLTALTTTSTSTCTSRHSAAQSRCRTFLAHVRPGPWKDPFRNTSDIKARLHSGLRVPSKVYTDPAVYGLHLTTWSLNTWVPYLVPGYRCLFTQKEPRTRPLGDSRVNIHRFTSTILESARYWFYQTRCSGLNLTQRKTNTFVAIPSSHTPKWPH